MIHAFRYAAIASLFAVAACTPGAPGALTSSLQSGTVVIHLGLTRYGATHTQYGVVSGYSPNPLVVTHGAVIQFENDDPFGHTASFVGTTGFPAAGPPIAAETQHGTDIDQPGWSTGELVGGAISRPFTVSTPGTYYYGCFHHYSLTPPMRGVIIVQ
jgi:plastocyanin